MRTTSQYTALLLSFITIYQNPVSLRQTFPHPGQFYQCRRTLNLPSTARKISRLTMASIVDLAHVDTTSIAAPQTTLEKPPALIEEAKRRAAIRAVDDYFDSSMHYVGIGSGTTIQYVVEAIKERCEDPRILFVPTGYQSRQEIEKRGLTAISFDSLPEGVMLDVAFDGADEVDEEFNCVKGGGACLFQEKLVATRAKKFVCVAGATITLPRLRCPCTNAFQISAKMYHVFLPTGHIFP